MSIERNETFSRGKNYATRIAINFLVIKLPL